MSAVLAGLLFLGASLAASAPDGPERLTPPVQRNDTEGSLHTLPDPAAKATVLVFLLPDCPIANSFAPEIQRLAEFAARQGAVMLRVYPDPAATAETVAEHARDYRYTLPAILDADQSLARALGVQCTPEAVVLDPTGLIAYRGRISDRYVGYGRYRQKATTHDLQDAIEAVLAGRPVKTPRTEAIGCFLPLIPKTPANPATTEEKTS